MPKQTKPIKWIACHDTLVCAGAKQIHEMAQIKFEPPVTYTALHVDVEIANAVRVERERCAKIVRRICGESAHVKLGDAIETAIFSL